MNLVKFTKEIRKQFNKNTILVRANERIQIKTIKIYFWIFLLEIFSMLQQNLLLQLSFDIYEGRTKMTITGLL